MDSEGASGCTGQRHGQQPVSGTADPGVVKQDKSFRGSVDTTNTPSHPQRVRMSSGEANRRCKRQTIRYRGLVLTPSPSIWGTVLLTKKHGKC